MKPLFGSVVFLFHVISEITGSIVLRLSEKTIDCASNAELTFIFISNKTNHSLPIAECDRMMNLCRLLEIPLENKFNISYTGRGGILSVLSLDENTVGTYKCCETYNMENFVSTDITESHYIPVLMTTHSTNDFHDTTTKATVDPVAVSVLIAMVICTTCISIIQSIVFANVKYGWCKGLNKMVMMVLKSSPEPTDYEVVDEEANTPLLHPVPAKETDGDQVSECEVRDIDRQHSQEFEKMRMAMPVVETLLKNDPVSEHHEHAKGAFSKKDPMDTALIKDTTVINGKTYPKRIMDDVQYVFKCLEVIRGMIFVEIHECTRTSKKHWPYPELRGICYCDYN